MTKKLILLDKDGTLVRPKSGSVFVQNPQDQILLPGVKMAIADLHGCMFAIASNQGGVEKGFKTIESLIAEMEFVLDLIPEIEVAYFAINDRKYGYVHRLESSYRSSLYENGEGMRKPSPGMILDLIKYMAATKESTIYIGDREEDKMAAFNAGVEFTAAEEWRKPYV